MKRVLGVVVVLLVVGALIFLFHSNPATRSPELGSNSSASLSVNSLAKNNVPSVSSTNAQANAPEIISVTPTNLAAKADELITDTNAPVNLPPEITMQNVRHAVRQFGEMFGGNPVGNNSEITSQLSGNNPKHINFIDPTAGMRVNASGELVDAWNTPYFFHQLSASNMEIHSAGPDRKLWTDDDLVTK